MKILILPLALLLAACGGDSDDPKQEGDLRIEVVSIEPDPPVVGQNTLVFSISDAEGEPVIGATVEVEPFMPHHNHGSTETPVVTDLGDGTYRADPVTFQMPGHWEVRIEAVFGDLIGSAAPTWMVE